MFMNARTIIISLTAWFLSICSDNTPISLVTAFSILPHQSSIHTTSNQQCNIHKNRIIQIHNVPCSKYHMDITNSKKYGRIFHSGMNSKTALQMGNFYADYQFTITGIISGIILSIGQGVSRNAAAEQAFEERIKEAQLEANYRRRMNNEQELSELDLRAELAEKSPSMYGPEAMERRERKKREMRNMDEDEDEDFENDNEMDHELSPEEIEEFEEIYGVKYDPYYDQPYFEDELPNDVDFYKDPYFGDRTYENGETFFRDGDMFWRKGSKPRMKFSWKK